jgi:AcrR family transcriptional regulator
VITLEQAIDAGRRYFLRHGTLDLTELATCLAVSRATLYRVVGSRDALLAEVLWRLAQDSLQHARASRTRDGVDGVLEVVRLFGRQLLASRPLRRFIASEPQTATRVLGTPDGGVHRLCVMATTRLFEEVGLSARRGLPVPWGRTGTEPGNGGGPAARLTEEPDRVAYLLVRIVESLCFAETAGTSPDLELAVHTIRAMLEQACAPRPSRVARLREATMCLMWTSVPHSLLSESTLPLAAGV